MKTLPGCLSRLRNADQAIIPVSLHSMDRWQTARNSMFNFRFAPLSEKPSPWRSNVR